MSVEELARLVLAMLDLQRAYFHQRTNAALLAAKEAEARVRAMCELVLTGPSLFGEG